MEADQDRKWAFLYNLHPAESFPLILGILILSQMFSFVTIQATALNAVFVPNCRNSSQIVLTRKLNSYLHHFEPETYHTRNLCYWLFPSRVRT